MLRLIPPALHRQLYRLAYELRRRWLRVRGGTLFGCSIAVRDNRGWLLMVRHSYGSGEWQFPGGGVGRDEPPEVAIRREIAEELSFSVDELALLGIVEESYHGATNVVHVFVGLAQGLPRPDGREIVEARFFPPDGLPAGLGQGARNRLRLLGI